MDEIKKKKNEIERTKGGREWGKERRSGESKKRLKKRFTKKGRKKWRKKLEGVCEREKKDKDNIENEWIKGGREERRKGER